MDRTDTAAALRRLRDEDGALDPASDPWQALVREHPFLAGADVAGYVPAPGEDGFAAADRLLAAEAADAASREDDYPGRAEAIAAAREMRDAGDIYIPPNRVLDEGHVYLDMNGVVALMRKYIERAAEEMREHGLADLTPLRFIADMLEE